MPGDVPLAVRRPLGPHRLPRAGGSPWPWLVVGLGLWGCGTDDTSADAGPGQDSPRHSGAPSDTGPTGQVDEIVVVSGPDVARPVGGEALLTRELRVTTAEPTWATLRIDGPCGRRTVVFPEAATEHVLPVLGLHADATHTLEVVLARGAVEQVVPLGTVQTEALSGLPPMEVLVHEPEGMEPGLLVVAPQQDAGPGWILALDEALHPVYALRRSVDDLVLDPDGTWVAIEGRRAVRWDIFGRVRRAWGGTLAQSLAHESFPLADGGLLTLVSELVPVSDYPTTDDLSETADVTVLSQAVLRYAPDGEVVERFSVSDLVDPTRVGYLSVDFPYDWAHTNTVVPWDDDAYLVGVRHLDVVVCLNRDGTVRWLLGDPTGWTEPWASQFLAPVGEVVWPRHAHALEVHEGGVVGLFDNGNFGGSPYDPPPPEHVQVSRGVGFRVDEGQRTVETMWSVPYEGLFTFAMGDADLLPETGNMLLTFSRVAEPVMHPRIVQVHPDTPTAAALDLRFGLDVRRWTYRAEVVASLYPDAVVETRGPVASSGR